MTAGDKEKCQDQGLDQHIEIMNLIKSNQRLAAEKAKAWFQKELLQRPDHADAEVLERILNLFIADKEIDMKVIRANGTQRHEEVFEMERDTFFDLLYYHTPTFLNQRQHFQKKIISLKGSNQLREAADTAKLWFVMERLRPHDQVPELGPSYHLLALGLFTSILRQYKYTSGSDLTCLHHLYTDKSALASERAHAGNAIVALCLQISNHEPQRVSAKKLRKVYMSVVTTILDLTIADEEKEIILVGCDNPYEFDCKASLMSNFTNNDIFEVEMELARHMIEDLTKMEKDKINPVDPALRYFTLILLCFLIGLALYINRASVSRWLKKTSRRYFLTPFKKLRDQWAAKAAEKEAATRKAARLKAEQEALRAASAEEELQRKKKEKSIADLKAAKEKAAREKEKAPKERQQQERRQAEERKSSGSTKRDAATPPQQVSPQPQEKKVKGGQSDMTKISIADHALASNLDDQAMIVGLIVEPVKIVDDEPLQHPLQDNQEASDLPMPTPTPLPVPIPIPISSPAPTHAAGISDATAIKPLIPMDKALTAAQRLRAQLAAQARAQGPPHIKTKPSLSNPSTLVSNECPICLENPRSCVLIPCGHIFCPPCSGALTTCPLCREIVESKVKAFF